MVLVAFWTLKPPYPTASAAIKPTKSNSVNTSTSQAHSKVKAKPLQTINKQIVASNSTVSLPAIKQPVVDSSDTYMQYIFDHESSNNPYAVNSIGCIGLGQACPGEKLLSHCPDLGDRACQVQFFTNYAVARYGSWYQAYIFWINNHWW